MPAPRDIYEPFEERFGSASSRATAPPRPGWSPTTRPGPRRGRAAAASPRPASRSRGRAGHRPPARAGTPGEIVVDMKMPNIVMRAYAGMPEKTAEDFRNLKLHTGDLGRMDEEGYLYFMDRVKDYIRRRGENVSSMEVERGRDRAPEVLEAAAIGVQGGRGRLAPRRRSSSALSRAGRRARPRRAARLVRRAACPTSRCPATCACVDHLPKTPTERVRKVRAARGRRHGRHVRPRRVSDPLDLGEAADYILSERPAAGRGRGLGGAERARRAARRQGRTPSPSSCSPGTRPEVSRRDARADHRGVARLRPARRGTGLGRRCGVSAPRPSPPPAVPRAPARADGRTG